MAKNAAHIMTIKPEVLKVTVNIAYIADVPFNDSIFLSKVVFTSKTSDMKKPVVLKQGMIADAEIVTEDATVLQRLTRNVIKAMKGN
jgi:HlyD family secretion protein